MPSLNFRAGLLILAFQVEDSLAAGIDTGADLARACRDRKAPGPCINYLLNVVEGHEAFAKWGAVAHRWCMPDVSYPELRKVYLNFIDTHTEVGELPVSEATVQAFADAYPCVDAATP